MSTIERMACLGTSKLPAPEPVSTPIPAPIKAILETDQSVSNNDRSDNIGIQSALQSNDSTPAN